MTADRLSGIPVRFRALNPVPPRPVPVRAEAIADAIRASGGSVWPAIVTFGITYRHALRIRRGWRPGGLQVPPIPYSSRGYLSGYLSVPHRPSGKSRRMARSSARIAERSSDIIIEPTRAMEPISGPAGCSAVTFRSWNDQPQCTRPASFVRYGRSFPDGLPVCIQHSRLALIRPAEPVQ